MFACSWIVGHYFPLLSINLFLSLNKKERSEEKESFRLCALTRHAFFFYRDRTYRGESEALHKLDANIMILSAHNKEIDSTEQSYSAAPVPPSSVPQHMMEEKNGTTKLQNHPMITDTQNQHDSSPTHHNGHHSAQCCSKGSSEHSSSSLESIPPASFMVQHSHTFHAQPLSTHAAAPVSNCNDDGSSSCSNFQSSEPSEGVSLDNHNRCINHGMSSDIYSRPTREDVLKRLSEALLRRSLTMVSYFLTYACMHACIYLCIYLYQCMFSTLY